MCMFEIMEFLNTQLVGIYQKMSWLIQKHKCIQSSEKLARFGFWFWILANESVLLDSYIILTLLFRAMTDTTQRKHYRPQRNHGYCDWQWLIQTLDRYFWTATLCTWHYIRHKILEIDKIDQLWFFYENRKILIKNTVLMKIR